jgi:hypothetical protein
MDDSIKWEKMEKIVTEKNRSKNRFCDAYSLKPKKTPRFYFFFKILLDLCQNGHFKNVQNRKSFSLLDAKICKNARFFVSHPGFSMFLLSFSGNPFLKNENLKKGG